MKLRITISKYHQWYLCQISLQFMLWLLPILTSKISPDFRDFSFHNQKFPGFWNLDSLALGESVTRFVPFFDQKIKDFSRTFKDTFPIFQGLHSVQRRALNLCLLQFFQNMHEQFYPEGLSVFAGLDKVSTEI